MQQRQFTIGKDTYLGVNTKFYVHQTLSRSVNKQTNKQTYRIDYDETDLRSWLDKTHCMHYVTLNQGDQIGS